MGNKYSTNSITINVKEIVYRKKLFFVEVNEKDLEILSPKNIETENFINHYLKEYNQITTAEGLVNKKNFNYKKSLLVPQQQMERMQTRSVLLRPWALDGHGEINNFKGILQAKKSLIESGLLTKIQHTTESESQVIGIDTFIYPTPEDETLAYENKEHKSFKIIFPDGNEIHSGDLVISMQHSPKEWEQIKNGEFTGYSLGYYAYHYDAKDMPIPNIMFIEIDLQEINSLKES